MASEGARGGGRGIPARARTEYECTFQARACPRECTVSSTLHAIGIKNSNGVLGKGWGAGGGRRGRGQGGLCAHMHSYGRPAKPLAPCLHLKGGGCPFPYSLFPPSVRLIHFVFGSAPRTCTRALLPTPAPPLRCQSSPAFPCLPLCLPLIHLVLTRSRQGTPNKASASQIGISSNTRHQYKACARGRVARVFYPLVRVDACPCLVQVFRHALIYCGFSGSSASPVRVAAGTPLPLLCHRPCGPPLPSLLERHKGPVLLLQVHKRAPLTALPCPRCAGGRQCLRLNSPRPGPCGGGHPASGGWRASFAGSS